MVIVPSKMDITRFQSLHFTFDGDFPDIGDSEVHKNFSPGHLSLIYDSHVRYVGEKWLVLLRTPGKASAVNHDWNGKERNDIRERLRVIPVR